MKTAGGGGAAARKSIRRQARESVQSVDTDARGASGSGGHCRATSPPTPSPHRRAGGPPGEQSRLTSVKRRCRHPLTWTVGVNKPNQRPARPSAMHPQRNIRNRRSDAETPQYVSVELPGRWPPTPRTPSPCAKAVTAVETAQLQGPSSTLTASVHPSYLLAAAALGLVLLPARAVAVENGLHLDGRERGGSVR